MLLASMPAVLALALLITPPGPPRPDECEEASPRVELEAAPAGWVPVVCMSPGVSLMLRFDSRLLPESVRIQGRERFADVALGQQTLGLTPRESLLPGERHEVEVCFADGAAPACVTLLVVAHPGLGLHQVDVFRHPRTVASFQQEAEAARDDARELRQQVEQCRAERATPGGLTALLASGLMARERGIAARSLSTSVTPAKSNALDVWFLHGYRAQGRVAVDVWLKNPGPRPWSAAGAVLRGAGGGTLKLLPLWQPEPVLPGAEPVRVVVEAEATDEEARGTYTLTLWDAERTRTVILGNVTFP